MASRLILDVADDGGLALTLHRPGEPPRSLPAATTHLTWLQDAEALEELRWYLEEFPLASYGAFVDRAADVAGTMDDVGRTVFATVIGEAARRAVPPGDRDRAVRARPVSRHGPLHEGAIRATMCSW